MCMQVCAFVVHYPQLWSISKFPDATNSKYAIQSDRRPFSLSWEMKWRSRCKSRSIALKRYPSFSELNFGVYRSPVSPEHNELGFSVSLSTTKQSVWGVLFVHEHLSLVHFYESLCPWDFLRLAFLDIAIRQLICIAPDPAMSKDFLLYFIFNLIPVWTLWEKVRNDIFSSLCFSMQCLMVSTSVSNFCEQ